MKKSISKKIFLITIGFIGVLIILMMLFQLLFFQKFYVNKKKEILENSVQKFVSTYSYNIKSEGSLYTALLNFEQKNSSKVGIYSSSGEAMYLPEMGSSQSESSKFLSRILGTLYIKNDYADALLSSHKTITTIYQDPNSNLKHIVSISPMSLRTKNDSIIIAVSSFEVIQEASSIIGEFYIFIFIAVLVLGLILSYIYNALISKPLIKLNNTAQKMSSMDFSEQCSVNSEDEIGNLAKTLNFLSINLSKALSDLRDRNRQLQADISRERQLEKIRKDFIAGVSHELKTPIGIIEGYAEGLKDNIVEGEARDFYLDVIIDESKKMNKLVLDMLELSKLESADISIKPRPFNLIEVTEKIIKKLQILADEKHLHILRLYEIGENITVIGDDFKIEQVISNFLNNAIKYTNPHEKININIFSEGNLAKFEIENTGVFLNKNDLEKVWHQFYRVDKSRSRESGSYGLGLAIVKQILTLHHSTFGVKNTSTGVMFFFTLQKQ